MGLLPCFSIAWCAPSSLTDPGCEQRDGTARICSLICIEFPSGRVEVYWTNDLALQLLGDGRPVLLVQATPASCTKRAGERTSVVASHNSGRLLSSSRRYLELE